MKEDSGEKETKTVTPKEDNSGAASEDGYVEVLKESLQALRARSQSKEPCSASRALRHFARLRREVDPTILWIFINSAFQTSSDSALFSFLSSCIESLPPPPKKNEENDGDVIMKNDAEANDEDDVKFPKLAECKFDVQIFLTTLALVHLIDIHHLDNAVHLSTLLIDYMHSLPRLSVDDHIGAKAYFYFARAHELSGRGESVRAELLLGYREAVLAHDHMKQATTLNLLLRNYLQHNLYSSARKLVSKATFPESLRSNAQSARYLHYLGILQAVQLEYSEAHASLRQAIRKAPQPLLPSQQWTQVERKKEKGKPLTTLKSLPTLPDMMKELTTESKDLKGPATSSLRGRGFRLATHKLAIVVELLMGGIPERTLFNQPDLKGRLQPYRQIVDAVRSGDLKLFNSVMESHKCEFERDRTLLLIERLHHNVLRNGLYTTQLSYSRISLADVAKKVGLDNVEHTENIVAKAIADGVIEATIDRENQCLCSTITGDIYRSNEPSIAFHKRIAFCLQLHNDAIEAMRYPEDTRKPEEKTSDAEARRKEYQEQLARAEEAEDEDEDYL